MVGDAAIGWIDGLCCIEDATVTRFTRELDK